MSSSQLVRSLRRDGAARSMKYARAFMVGCTHDASIVVQYALCNETSYTDSDGRVIPTSTSALYRNTMALALIYLCTAFVIYCEWLLYIIYVDRQIGWDPKS